MGVDELFVRESGFTLAEEQDNVNKSSQESTAKDMNETTDLAQKTPLSPERNDSEFFASEDWNEEDDSVSNSSQPFGSYRIHDDVLHELLRSSVNRSSSAVSSSVLSSSIVQSSDGDDEVIDKSSKQQ